MWQIKGFEDLNLLSTDGLAWLDFFRSQFEKYKEAYEELLLKYQLLNQPYEFNAKMFFEENPLYI
jgi:hypothetical protein